MNDGSKQKPLPYSEYMVAVCMCVAYLYVDIIVI